jgi:thioredoxin-related protein
MKNTFYNFRLLPVLLLFLMLGCKSNSLELEKPADKVIDPNQVSWKTNINEALAEAKNRNELLFVYCFSPTCSHCQAVTPFFDTAEIAAKYNSNFTSYKLNLLKESEVKFLDDHNLTLPSWPRLLFFDGNGNLVHEASVEPNASSVLEAAKGALKPKERTGSYTKRFKDGERSIEFLSSYAKHTKVTMDTVKGIEVSEALFNAFPKDKLGSQESWDITKACVTDIDNGFAQYWLNDFNQAKAYEIEAGSPGFESNTYRGIIQSSLFGRKGQSYSYEKLVDIRRNVNEIGAGSFANNLLWEFEVKALIRENKLPQALAVGNKMITEFKGNASAYIYITSIFNTFYTDASYVPTAIKWISEANAIITQDNVKAEYYYELSRINQKSGDKEGAKKNANEALKLANKVNAKPEKFMSLIKSLN